ncbi:hypothetical protein C0995_014049 [Termitomyces sp. Mi166|nr:hypothetical protein C0995_014049 [Termitomyces sp. Mi166\
MIVNHTSEIAELMQMKSKHGAGGEFSPNWKPTPPLLEAGEQPPALPDPPALVQARPGWRTVHPAPERRQRSARTVPKSITQAPAAPTAFPVPSPAPEPQIPAWAHWRPNPLIAPTPVVGSPMSPHAPPPVPGLFGAAF